MSLFYEILIYFIFLSNLTSFNKFKYKIKLFKQRKYLVHGGFGSWSAFSECSQTCGSGTMHRSRTCSNPEPRGQDARNCTGFYEEVKHCRLAECVGNLF